MSPRRIVRVGALLALVLSVPAAAADLAPLRARYEREKGQPYATRYPVLQEISQVGTDDAARLLIQIAEKDDDASMRSNAVFWLGYVKRPLAREGLIRFYRDGPEALRSSALNALANGSEPMPKDILDGALASTEQGTRSTAIRHLQRIRDPRFLPEARRFLVDFPTGAASIVSTLVADRSPAAARLLVTLYDDSQKYQRDQVPKVFADGGPEVRAVLVEVLSGRVSVEEFRNAAILAARAKVTEAEPAVVAALAGSAEERRVILLETIGALGATTVPGRTALREALADRSEAIRTAAVRALRNAPDRLAVLALIDLLERETDLARLEVRVTLERMTGQQYGDRVDLWRKWWETYGEAFDPAAVKKPEPGSIDQALIDLAIAKGAAALRRIRGKEPPWEYASHPVGTTALVLLALHAANEDPKDPDVRAGLKYLLDASAPTAVYDLGIEAMALETIGGKKFRRRIGECAQRLVATQLGNGMWGYPTGNGDNSNTQYAVLGLRHAARAGIPIPAKVWRAIRRHFIDTKAYEGGWTYPGIERSTTSSASMTAAALSSLLICLENEGLKPEGPEDVELRRTIDEGFIALGKIMNVDTDSLYALYGIERAAVLGHRAVFGDKAWYPLGATRLVSEQDRDGLWRGSYGEAVDTAFAVLFLKKATAPLTGR